MGEQKLAYPGSRLDASARIMREWGNLLAGRSETVTMMV
jgi:hypothetical protein